MQLKKLERSRLMLFKKIHKVEMESKHENDETEELSEEELEFQDD